MKASGQCPVCEQQQAWQQDASTSAHLLRCDCDAELHAFRWADGDEIGVRCGGCGAEHVFHAAGAGENVRCGCGESLHVPTHRLAVRAIDPGTSSDEKGTPENEVSPVAAEPEPVPLPEAGADVSRDPASANVESPEQADPEPKEPVTHAAPRPSPTEVEPITLVVPREEGLLSDATTVTDSGDAEENEPDGQTAEPAAKRTEESRTSTDPTPTLVTVSKAPEAKASACPNPKPHADDTSLVLALEKDPTNDVAQLSSDFSLIRQDSIADSTQVTATAHIPVQSTARHELTIQCPACRAEYLVPRTEEGQTAECECGFVFLQTSPAVVEATDTLLRADLFPGIALLAERRSGSALARTPPKTAPRELLPTRQVKSTTAATHSNPTRSIAALRAIVHAGLTLSAAFLIGFFVMQWFSDPSRKATAQDRSPTDSAARPLVVRRADPIGPLRALVKEFGPETPLGIEQLRQFGSAVADLESERDSLGVEDVFWVAQTWQTLGGRVPQRELADKCYRQAATAYAFAKAIAPPQSEGGAVAEQRMQAILAAAKRTSAHR
ncbi:MAG: hypothetical protein AAFU85_03080 [Planctomycetota bacterium]